MEKPHGTQNKQEGGQGKFSGARKLRPVRKIPQRAKKESKAEMGAKDKL